MLFVEFLLLLAKATYREREVLYNSITEDFVSEE